MSDKYVQMKVPPRAEILYEFAQQPAFPICIVEFEEDNNIKEPVTKIKVNKKMLDRIKKDFGTNQLILYCDISKNSPVMIGSFSPDMQESFSILKTLKLVNSEKEWVLDAQKNIKDSLEEEDEIIE